MVFRATELAAGDGWSVQDYVCQAGPRDRPYEETHATICIAAVTGGTFDYRSAQGRATLVPGALLLGNHGRCFACAHEHGVGDRCVAFHYAPAVFETILREVPGARRLTFAVPRLPPTEASLPLVAAACRDRDQPDRLEELALTIAARTIAMSLDGARATPIGPRDRDGVIAIVRRLEAAPMRQVTLAQLAREAAMSPFRFLRAFRAVTGTTPYRYVLDLRLRVAAERLASTARPVTAIALDAGFNDLSEFNRRFKRVFGVAPRAYRRRL